MKDIETRLKELISDDLGVDEAEITPDARIAEDLGADSIDALELVIGAEAVPATRG